jgi:hypothetical protein
MSADSRVLHVSGKKQAGLAIQVSMMEPDLLDGYLVKMVSGHTVGQMQPVQSVVVDSYDEAARVYEMYVKCMNIAMGEM